MARKADPNDLLKQEMLAAIFHGGAWFSTRNNNYLKIAFNETDGCLYARECMIKDGTLEGGAYTFGTDWFDIYFHGRYIDIYTNPETFKRWKVWYDAERGTCYSAPADQMERAKRLVAFCRQADEEALAGGLKAYHISSADFAKVIELSEERLESEE